MAYETVTVEQFMARFPIFSDKDEDYVQTILTEAGTQIDNTWREEDYSYAIMYLTAHMIATDNSEEGGEVSVGDGAGGGISSESFGGMSVSYGKANTTQAKSLMESDYLSTSYGRRYLKLVRVNFPAIVSI